MQVRAQRHWYPSFCRPFLAYINDGDPLLATISFKARPATTSNPHVVASFLRRPRWTHAIPAVLNAAIFYLLLFSQSQHLKYKSSNPCCQMICQKCENTDFTLCDWLIKRWRGRYKNRRYKIKRYSMVWIPTDPKVHCESMNFVCVRNRYFAATLFSFHSRDGDADQPGGVVGGGPSHPPNHWCSTHISHCGGFQPRLDLQMGSCLKVLLMAGWAWWGSNWEGACCGHPASLTGLTISDTGCLLILLRSRSGARSWFI